MSSSLPPLQLIPEPISRLIRLFEERADDLKFPDVDAASLSAAVSEMDARRAAVDDASAQLETAREELVQAQQLLLDRARQAHAYASVFALSDEKLQEELAQIKMGSTQRTTRKRKPAQKEAAPDAKEMAPVAKETAPSTEESPASEQVSKSESIDKSERITTKKTDKEDVSGNEAEATEPDLSAAE